MTTPQNKARYTLENVCIFDGHRVCEPSTFYISDGYIVTSHTKAKDAQIQVIDCKNGVLLPGFIDAHVHLDSEESLKQLASNGITTALDMGNWPPSKISSLRSLPGSLPSILSAGLIATSPGSKHSGNPNLPAKSLITTKQQAQDFVAERVAEKSDYIKIIADIPGPSQEVMDAIVESSRGCGKLSVAHAGNHAAFAMAQRAGVDVITHSPLDAVLDDSLVSGMKAAGTIAVPTLSMMEGMSKKIPIPIIKYSNARDSVIAMHEAGLTILVGTDANAQPGVPFSPPFGDSVHHEMELLVEAGMSSVEVLRGATSDVARVFGLGDRGVVEVGKRADLVLLGGDPVEDIRETRNVRRVWCGGVEVDGITSRKD